MDISLSGTPALIAIIVFVGLPVWFVVIVIARIRRKAHDINIKWDNIVKAEYEPPLNLTPAELGYLTDSKFDKKEMVATLLDLEQRGFVNINKSSYGYEIVKIGSDSNSLSAHEKFIYESKTSGNEIIKFINWKQK